MSDYLCVCLFVCLSVWLYVSVSLSVCLSFCVSVCLSVFLCLCLSVSVCLYVCLCVCLSVCVSVCLFVCVCLFLCLYGHRSVHLSVWFYVSNTVAQAGSFYSSCKIFQTSITIIVRNAILKDTNLYWQVLKQIDFRYNTSCTTIPFISKKYFFLLYQYFKYVTCT